MERGREGEQKQKVGHTSSLTFVVGRHLKTVDKTGVNTMKLDFVLCFLHPRMMMMMILHLSTLPRTCTHAPALGSYLGCVGELK